MIQNLTSPPDLRKTIVFLSKGESSPSTRYRALQFFPLLSSGGYSPCHFSIAGGVKAYAEALRKASEADVVVVLRKIFPAPLLWLLRKVSRRLVFDFDDAIFCNSDGSPSVTRMQRFAAMVRACDHVIAGNGFLADTARQFASNVTVIPTCVHPEKYAGIYPKPSDTIDLVWIGSSSTRKYLVDGLPGLRLASRLVPTLRLKIVADFDLPDAGLPTFPVRWSEAIEAEALGSSHIGIAPMGDDPWSRGKCALKVLQYMAAGLPVVSSAAGANAEIVCPAVTGFLASNPESWAHSISLLANDEPLRKRMSDEGLRRVVNNYSIEPACRSMCAVFDTILNRPDSCSYRAGRSA